jgi:FlaA1/EpsC-like NDP-sugar epimerase
MQMVEADEWTGFLHSTCPGVDEDCLQAEVWGKSVLVTGAGGWIGSAMAQSLADFGAAHIVLLDSAERNLFEVYSDFGKKRDLVAPVLGSVCDRSLLREVMRQHQPQTIVHAAACKHVSLMEQNPFAVVANNAVGTWRLGEVAAEFDIESVIMISTDKAADPVSIMGASKRAAELGLLAWSSRFPRWHAVRLGNVLGSPGSVVPLMRRQIAKRGPVTVTHPEARRYFVSLRQAIHFLLSALCVDGDGAILVPEMGEARKILDLASYLIGDREIAVRFTELRPGEKIEEALISRRESYAQAEPGGLRRISTPRWTQEEMEAKMRDLEQAVKARALAELLETLRRTVPEYEPGEFLLGTARTSPQEAV